MFTITVSASNKIKRKNLISKANNLFAKGDYQGALKKYEEYTKLFPT